MKKFTMLGASLVMLLVATACMSSATKNVKTEAGTGTAKISAIGEVSTFQIHCSDLNANFIAGEKMNIPTTTLVSSSTKKEAATEIKTNATGGAGIMPEETAIISNSKKTGTKNKVEQKNNCNCASCIEMTKYATMSIGGNSA